MVEARRSRSKPSHGVVSMRHDTKNQRHEVVQTALLKIYVPARG